MSIITVAGDRRPGEPDAAAFGGQMARSLRRDFIGVGFFGNFIAVGVAAFVSLFGKMLDWFILFMGRIRASEMGHIHDAHSITQSLQTKKKMND